MLIVPVQAVPNQTFSILLAGQQCQITLLTKFYGLFFTLSVNNTLVRSNVKCQDRNPLLRYPYIDDEANFAGDFFFLDTQGTDDPVYTGIGSRFLFEYIEASDIAVAEAL